MAALPEEIIKQKIIDQLIWDDSVNANDVQVEVQESTVQLRGTVPNYTAKLAAERDALNVPGVMNLESFLKVEFPPRITLPDDAEISRNIKSMLTLNTRVNAINIDVTTSDGIVTLSGTADSYWEKYEAEDVANTAHGVVEVINKIVVKPVKSVIDREIEADIRNAYERSSLIDESKIDVYVKNGVAHLTGVAENTLIKNEVFKKALYTTGVVDVIDEVTVA
jgi:osmotically-inducible protein OsmY